jgi:integrase
LSNGTINRELALLGKALRLAEERGQMLRVPRIHLLQESAPRSGFFERSDFERVRKHLAKRPDLQVAISLAHTFGWRMQSEVLQLHLSQIDLAAGTLRLEPGTTKNREGRTVYLTPELVPLVREQIERVTALSRTINRVVTYFPEPSQGTVSRGSTSGLQKSLAHCLQKDWTDRDAPTRFPTQCREELGAFGGRGDGGEEDQRTQDTFRLRSLQHHERCGSSRGRPQASRAQFGRRW